jgi:branched-chain amino acid aminotransferase
MGLKVYVAGKLVDKEQATINVYDHGLLYGDGIFEGLRAYGGKVFKFEEHLRRLWDSAKAIRLEIPISKEDMAAATYETMKANGLSDCYIRMVVTRGVGSLGLSPFKCPTPVVFIIADTIELYPPKMYEDGIAAVTAATIRNHPNTLSPRIKSLNYLNNILAKIEAVDAGVHDAIMLNHEGYVAEATGANVFAIRDGVVRTPHENAGILVGVTRDVLIELCGRIGLTVKEGNLTRHDLYIADEVFLTGTAAEVISVTSLDKRTIGTGRTGPHTKRLMAEFKRYTKGE